MIDIFEFLHKTARHNSSAFSILQPIKHLQLYLILISCNNELITRHLFAQYISYLDVSNDRAFSKVYTKISRLKSLESNRKRESYWKFYLRDCKKKSGKAHQERLYDMRLLWSYARNVDYTSIQNDRTMCNIEIILSNFRRKKAFDKIWYSYNKKLEYESVFKILEYCQQKNQ